MSAPTVVAATRIGIDQATELRHLADQHASTTSRMIAFAITKLLDDEHALPAPLR